MPGVQWHSSEGPSSWIQSSASCSVSVSCYKGHLATSQRQLDVVLAPLCAVGYKSRCPWTVLSPVGYYTEVHLLIFFDGTCIHCVACKCLITEANFTVCTQAKLPPKSRWVNQDCRTWLLSHLQLIQQSGYK